jgi:hypothetical protein
MSQSVVPAIEEKPTDTSVTLTFEEYKVYQSKDDVKYELYIAEISSLDYPGERLIACRNPMLAEDRAKTREELLQATEKELAKIVAATKKKKNRLKGASDIALKVGKMVNRYQVAKHFKLDIQENSFSYERNTRSIESEAALDGLYVIRTSVEPEVLSPIETVRAR